MNVVKDEVGAETSTEPKVTIPMEKFPRLLAVSKEISQRQELVKCLNARKLIIIEGEEEVGSVSLAGFLEENKEKLSCDVILISDTHIYSNEQPTVTTGLRGLLYGSRSRRSEQRFTLGIIWWCCS